MILAFEGHEPKVDIGVFVAPNAALVGDVHIGKRSSVWFGAVVRGDYGPIRIGSGCSVQDNAVVHVNHNAKGEVFATIIDDDCVVGHGAVIEGCHIEKGCLIGMNAVVLPDTVIGKGSIVAAGSVVMSGQTIPPFSLVAGSPAVVKHSLSKANPTIAWAADEYKSLADRYLANEKKQER